MQNNVNFFQFHFSYLCKFYDNFPNLSLFLMLHLKKIEIEFLFKKSIVQINMIIICATMIFNNIKLEL
jgi:hypothetical protein